MVTFKIILSLIIFAIIVFFSSGPNGSSAVSEPFNVFSVLDEKEILRVDRQILGQYFEGLDFKGYKPISARKTLYIYTYVHPEVLCNSRYFASGKVADLEDIINAEFRAFFNENYGDVLLDGVDFKNHIYVHITKGKGRVYVERKY